MQNVQPIVKIMLKYETDINERWMACKEVSRSYPGEIVTRRKRTLELQVTFLCADPIFFQGERRGQIDI